MATARRIELGKVVATASFWLDASVGPDGRARVHRHASPNVPPSSITSRRPTPTRERLTDFNRETAALELGRTETVHWENDGFHVDGVVTYPPDFAAAKKYPLVLYVHGGPRSASKEAFSSRAQLLAAQGWVVFEPNYRGSDNLGNAFQAAIWNDAGAGPGRDVMAGVAVLEKRGFVDSSRMAVSGWSYGGYMTTWLLGNYPDRWKAAIAGAAVTDWLDQYDYGDANVRRGTGFGGSPYTDAKRMQAYREQSPITYASQHQSADADSLRHRRLPRAHHAIVPALSRAGRQRRDDAVHRVPGFRPQPQRPGALARYRPALDRLARQVSRHRRRKYRGAHTRGSPAASPRYN